MIITSKQEAFEKVSKVAEQYGITEPEFQFQCYEAICDELEKNGCVTIDTYVGIFNCISTKQNISENLRKIDLYETNIELLIERCKHEYVRVNEDGVKSCGGCGAQFDG